MRVGSVPYLNAVPLIQGLRGVRLAPPAELARLFHAGELDVALLPVVEAFDHPDLRIVPGIAIASRGACDSVRLHVRRTPIRGFRPDPHSRTSNALARFLFPGDGDDAELTIGDPTFARPTENTIDLGEAWFERTGLPFVFAVWLTREPERCGFLAEAKAAGLARLETIAAEEAPRRGIDPERARIYLTERMRYDLGPDEQAGMERFRRWYRSER